MVISLLVDGAKGTKTMYRFRIIPSGHHLFLYTSQQLDKSTLLIAPGPDMGSEFGLISIVFDGEGAWVATYTVQVYILGK